MKPGQASRTAELVCMGRAIAHGASPVARYEDPTAIAMLSPDARRKVEDVRNGVAPRGVRARLRHVYLERQSKAMVVRTVTIDDAVRDAAAPQIVVLGAGLDGRAWRMAELRDAVVFEVDHPDTQRVKRERVATLERRARDVRFVPVDFTRDSLDEALATAGHDATKPTAWIWEGVVMYLTPHEVDATLEVIAKRSATGSRVIVVYHRPALLLKVVGLALGRIGEPLRSAFTPEEMRAALAAHGMRVVHDDDLSELARAMHAGLGRATEAMRHIRIAVAATA